MTNTDHSVSGAEDRVVVERVDRQLAEDIIAIQFDNSHAAYLDDVATTIARHRLAALAQTPDGAGAVREADMEKAFLRGYEEARLDWPNDEREVSARLYVAGMRVALAATTSVPAISEAKLPDIGAEMARFEAAYPLTDHTKHRGGEVVAGRIRYAEPDVDKMFSAWLRAVSQ